MQEFYQNSHSSIFAQSSLIQTTDSVAVYSGACCNIQNIEYMVELEMSRIKHNWLQSEHEYVEHLLQQNPISMERRPMNNRQQLQIPNEIQSGDEVIDVVSVVPESETDRKQQRADACRRSRYNKKIRNAKCEYRRSHMLQKLESSIQWLDSIEKLVAHSESRLLSRGFSRDRLQHLRTIFKLDTVSSSRINKGNAKNVYTPTGNSLT